jgi:ribosomal protein S27AE
MVDAVRQQAGWAHVHKADLVTRVWWSGRTPTCPRCLATIADHGDYWDCMWCTYREPITDVDARLVAYRERVQQVLRTT